MAKKMSGTITMAISVPRELKAKMGKVTEAVNWSAIACQAFQNKLGEIAAKKEKKTMNDVIDRLRASAQKSVDEDCRTGFEYGQDWAKNHGEVEELKALEKLADNLGSQSIYDWVWWFGEQSNDAFTLAEHLYFEIHPEDDHERAAASNFWEMHVGNTKEAEKLLDSGMFLKGFAEGALDIWQTVKGQL